MKILSFFLFLTFGASSKLVTQSYLIISLNLFHDVGAEIRAVIANLWPGLVAAYRYTVPISRCPLAL